MKKPYSAHRLGLFTCLVAGLVSFSVTARADYLIPPEIAGFEEPCPPPVKPYYYNKPHHKVHHKKVHHHKSYRYYCYSCQPNEIVKFDMTPGAAGHGRYVTDDDYCYDPDLTTGDDDPCVHPDMNINN